MCVYIVKLPSGTLPQWRQFGWRQCDLRQRADALKINMALCFQYSQTYHNDDL